MMKIKYKVENQSESIKQKCSRTQTELNGSQYCRVVSGGKVLSEVSSTRRGFPLEQL